jgi:toxin YoeB
MLIIFHPNAWEDYLHWQQQDRGMLRKFNNLIRDIERDPYSGIGKPEALRFDLTGCWSRRIDQEHRLVYRMDGEALHVLACRYHY